MHIIQNLAEKLDPNRQSFLYFRYSFSSVLCLIGTTVLCHHFLDSRLIHQLLDNIFVYFPNYMVHEFSHRIGWSITHSQTMSLWAGPVIEVLFPVVLYLFFMRLPGGRWLGPFTLYYLATALHSAAVYCADARAMKLNLTSSDMISNHGPGTPGDWYYMLKPLGLLEYDLLISQIFYWGACFFLVMAVYSLWYYFGHMDEYTLGDVQRIRH